MSPQPIFGGPVYFVRNVVYNGVYGPLKIQADPSGILVYQNTYVGEVAQLTPASNMHFRNNLILGQGARPAVFAIDTHTSYSSSDYNGFRERGPIANTGSPRVRVSVEHAAAGQAGGLRHPRETRRFTSLADYSRATGQDKHSREVDYYVFVNAAAPDFAQTDAAVLSGASGPTPCAALTRDRCRHRLTRYQRRFRRSSARLGRLRAGRRAAALRTA